MWSSQRGHPVGQAARNFSPLQKCSMGQKADETPPAKTLRNTPGTPANRLQQIRQKQRCSKEDMFREVLQPDERQAREHKEYWEANAAFARQVRERMIKVMEDQTEMLKSLIQLQTEQFRGRPPWQHMHMYNSLPIPPLSMPTRPFSLHSTPEFPHHSPPLTA
ncbi:unnamed protein product [Caretta caretta]